MIAPDWEFNGVVRSPSGYGSSRSLSSLETNDVKTMDLGFMRFKEDEEEESDDINVHGHTKLELGLSRSDSNACEEDESTFKADHGFRRILVTSLTTDSDVNDDQVGGFYFASFGFCVGILYGLILSYCLMIVGETAGIVEQENAPAACVNKAKRSGPEGPKVMYVVFLGFFFKISFSVYSFATRF